MDQNEIKVKKIGDSARKFSLPYAKSPLMYMSSLQYQDNTYIIACSLDSYLFCLPISTPNKETFHIKLNCPITSTLYTPATQELYCGDLMGSVCLFKNFPLKQFSKCFSMVSRIPEQIDDYVMGMYVNRNRVISVHASMEVNRWRVDQQLLVSERQDQIPKRPCVLVPILNQEFNLIIGINGETKPLVLKDVDEIQARIESNGLEIKESDQITDLAYNQWNSEVVAGYFSGVITVYSIHSATHLCTPLIKFNNFGDRILKVRVMGDYLVGLSQVRIFMVHQKERQMVSSKENTKVGLLETSGEELFLANIYDPLMIPEIEFVPQSLIRVLNLKSI